MDSDIWKSGRLNSEVRANPFAYHFEYLSLQNDRINIVQLSNRWRQIAITSSVVTFGGGLSIILVYGSRGQEITPLLLFVPVFIAWFILYMSWSIANELDKGLTKKIYPRLVALELLLDYHFFRNYLKQKGTYHNFILRCEGISNKDSTIDLWHCVKQFFDETPYSTEGRFVKKVEKFAWSLAAVYFIIAVLVWLVVWPPALFAG